MVHFQNRHPLNSELFNAILNNDIKTVKRITDDANFDSNSYELITNGLRFDCTEEDFRDTPLHYAARRNKKEIISILLQSCYNMIESKNKDAEFPAHVALKMNHLESFKLLCNGSVATARNKHWKNMLHLAVIHNAVEVIEFLCKKVDVNSKTEKGFSPVIFAAMRGNCKIVKILIRADANLTAINLYGDTALHAAVRYDQKDVCQILVTHGSEIDPINGHGDTPLKIAICRKNTAIVKLLLKHGASKEIRDSDGLTPFEIAVKEFEESRDAGSYLMIELLKDSKAAEFFKFMFSKLRNKKPYVSQNKIIKRCKTHFDTRFPNSRAFENYSDDQPEDDETINQSEVLIPKE